MRRGCGGPRRVVHRKPHRKHWLRAALLFALALLASLPAMAQEAWLITYGPGGDTWSRFGHNAIMIRDTGQGAARNYAFGYFDMNRPGFLTDFLQGILIYEGHATDAEREMALYRAQDRSVRRQRLNLSAEQVERFHALLREQVRPDNRRYEYDYYFHNCSTRLRDLLNRVLDGALRREARELPARLNLRDHTHRLSQDDFWLHTGLMLVLGPGIDGERSAWEEMFLPAAMASQLARLELDGEPLVTEDHYWYESRRYAMPAEPSHRFASYALAGLTTVAILLLPPLLLARPWRWWPLKAFALVNAVAGLGLLALWVASAHDAIWRNAVLFLLNPLWLLLCWRGTARAGRTVLAVLGLATLIGAVVLAWPGGYQYRPAPLLWLVPANLGALATAWLWWRSRAPHLLSSREPEPEPGAGP